MKAEVHDISGKVVDSVDLDDGCFGAAFNSAVVHQAMLRQLANARLGTAATKTRAEVTGSTRKLYRQKHTGRARRGDIKAPGLRGGGVVFGPHPRSYHQDLPKKMLRLALKSVLSEKARDGELIVVSDLHLENAKTKEMAAALKALRVEGKVLILMHAADAKVIRASRNLPGVKTLPVALLNVADLLDYRYTIFTREAAQRVGQIWGASSPLL